MSFGSGSLRERIWSRSGADRERIRSGPPLYSEPLIGLDTSHGDPLPICSRSAPEIYQISNFCESDVLKNLTQSLSVVLRYQESLQDHTKCHSNVHLYRISFTSNYSTTIHLVESRIDLVQTGYIIYLSVFINQLRNAWQSYGFASCTPICVCPDFLWFFHARMKIGCSTQWGCAHAKLAFPTHVHVGVNEA